MNAWVIAAVVVGIAALGVLGWSLARLSRALKDVRRGLEDLARVAPAAQRVNGEIKGWRSSVRDN